MLFDCFMTITLHYGFTSIGALHSFRLRLCSVKYIVHMHCPNCIPNQILRVSYIEMNLEPNRSGLNILIRPDGQPAECRRAAPGPGPELVQSSFSGH